MTGYAMLYAPCGACGKMFTSNPTKVPSLNNIPFCKECVDAINPLREKKGLEKIKYADDAYEGCPEEELGQEVNNDLGTNSSCCWCRFPLRCNSDDVGCERQE